MSVEDDVAQGFAAFGREEYEAASNFARAALRAAPGDPGALTLVGRLALVGCRPDVALQVFQQLSNDSSPADTWLDLARTFVDMRQEEQALEAARHAVALFPQSVAAWLFVGDTLISLNRRGEAMDAYRRALVLAPDQPNIYRRLGRSGELTPSSPETAKMEKMIAAGGLSSADVAELHYGLSVVYKRAGEPKKFIAHVLAANDAQKEHAAIDRALHNRARYRLKTAFTPENFAKAQTAAAEGPTPIFITGMPRSGTTLVEQIVGGAPDVAIAGELKYRRNLLPRAMLALTKQQFPEGFETLSREQLTQIAHPLTHLLGVIGQGARFVTDKTLDNREILGLLARLFPAAKMLLLKRDPMDVCFSILQQPFEAGVSHSFDMGLVAYVYGHHVELMQLWREVLADRMFEIDYERLASSPEPETRKFIEYCGFTWDPALLEFHKRDAGVRTFSESQVRKPVYTDSIGSWRAFADELAPLRHALTENGVSFAE